MHLAPILAICMLINRVGMALKLPAILPKLIVFDLDMCLWSPEMYELSVVPVEGDKIIGKLGKLDQEGCIKVKSGGHDTIQLFPAALQVLQHFYNAACRNEFWPVGTSLTHKQSRDTNQLYVKLVANNRF